MLSLMIDGFDRYIRTELGLSQETICAYKTDVKEFLDFAGNRKLTAQILEEFVRHLRLKQLKLTTVRRKCMSVRCFYHHLVSLGLIDNNTLSMIDPVRTERKTQYAIERKDVDVLISTLRNRTPICRTDNIRRDVAIILILYYSGLRISELCNLSLLDVNFNRREIRVMGKGSIERVVPTTHECIDAIKSYVDTERKSNTNRMFVQSNGSKITRRAISGMIASLSCRSGIRHTTAHTLRRSCATSLMNDGVDLELIQSLLGHQHISTTQSYLSVSPNRLVEIHKTCHPFGEKCEV